MSSVYHTFTSQSIPLFHKVPTTRGLRPPAFVGMDIEHPKQSIKYIILNYFCK